MPDAPITVLVVDDIPDTVAILARLVNSQPDMRCIGTLTSADRLVEAGGLLGPDVAIVDLTMPGRPPLDSVRELSRSRPDTRVLIFSGHDDGASADAAMAAGAWGLLSKDAAPAQVLESIRRVARGEICLPGH